MKILTRVEGYSELYDVEYITIWEWLRRRFSYPQYVKNVKEVKKMGFTYEPRLYTDEDLPRPI